MTTRYSKYLSILVLTSAVTAFADDRVKALPEDDRRWLEEEVVYIISPSEREVFLELKTSEERALFQKAFWERRDPNPATPENEFLKEHYRRLEYAVRVLGRDSTRPGFRTDRGRYYIILGPPAEIQRYDGSNEVVTMELWLYNGDTSAGLPARFNLLFFKENDIGEYRLYHPFSDGPEALLHSGFSYRANQNVAVDLLETVSIDVARASLTIDLSEPTAQMLAGRNSRDPILLQVRPSMAVDRNLAEIAEYPVKKIDTEYLEGYLRFGNRVSADYSFNYVDSRSTFAVLFGPYETPFIHYSVEIPPEHLTLESNEDKTSFYTTMQVSLELRDREGRLIAITENQPFLQLTASQFEQAKSFPFAYRDSFPALPGEYLVSVILRNRASKQYTVAERAVAVPEPHREPALGDLILAAKLDDVLGAAGDEHKTFQLGTIEIDPVTERAFTASSTVHMVTQVPNVAKPNVRFSLLSGDDVLFTEKGRFSDEASGAVTGSLTLLRVEPGEYSVRAELLDDSGAVVDQRSEPLTVSPRTSIPRAGFVYRHSFGADVPGLIDMTLGEQLMVMGRIDEAEARLRRALGVADDSRLAMAKWKLASVLLFRREADEALRLLLPLESEHPNQIEVVEGLGFSYYIKEDYTRATPFLEKAREMRPPDTSLLNALGDCYQRLANPEKAREMFELSLELNPRQDGVKQRLALLASGG